MKLSPTIKQSLAAAACLTTTGGSLALAFLKLVNPCVGILACFALAIPSSIYGIKAEESEQRPSATRMTDVENNALGDETDHEDTPGLRR